MNLKIKSLLYLSIIAALAFALAPDVLSLLLVFFAAFTAVLILVNSSANPLQEKIEDLLKNRAVNHVLDDLMSEKMKDAAILESMGDGVIVLDTNENVILMNKAAQRMLVYDPYKCVGQSWETCTRPKLKLAPGITKTHEIDKAKPYRRERTLNRELHNL